MSAHTQGPWRVGKRWGCVIADHPVPGLNGSDDVAAYGGHLIAESIAPQNLDLIAAAPKLLASLREVAAFFHAAGDGCFSDDALARIDAAIAKAEGQS